MAKTNPKETMHNAAIKVNKLCQTLNAKVSLFECHYLSHYLICYRKIKRK